MVSMQLAYEACPWTAEEIHAFVVMRSIIGSATAFSSGGPGKGMYCRSITHMMQQYGFVQSANVISSHFMDSGLFGIKAVGPGSHSMDLLSSMLE
jgi:mitochondrial-processing peptidase subunit alpha